MALFKSVSAAAVVGGALLALRQPDGRLDAAHFSTAVFARASLTLWLAGLVLGAAWSVLVYPHFVSPLRHLPTPPGGHWLLGHGPFIVKSAPGVPVRTWYG
ncbi:hypothetical protein ESCO_004797 [Escovopsis weberi]|uniref:Uncharacterized protein n=1 Tax=Escovopsis weberi TaxID=150374 RepID=A0A0M9VRM5_ESCWE|nr:hypothetical protein ESCO_004797 [Escovopsis weberi]